MTNRHVIEGADKVKIKPRTPNSTAKCLGGPRVRHRRGEDNATGLTRPSWVFVEDQGRRVRDRDRLAVELNYSVTVGHVSAKGRRVFSDQFMFDQDFIQTDAAPIPATAAGCW